MADTLDLVQLRSVVAIATCGGVGRAATALHLSQPAVSQHVRLLERRLQRALLVRDGRRARLTPAGHQLVDEARRILAVHDEALARLSATTTAPLVVGCADAVAEHVLPTLRATLRAAWPDRRVRFTVDRSSPLAADVARGAADLAVVVGASGDAPGRLAGLLPLRWYGRDHDVAGEDVVAYTEPCGLRVRALGELADSGRRAEVMAEATSLEGVVAAARAGLGVAALPSAVAPAGLVERTDLPPLGVVGVHLVTRGARGVRHRRTRGHVGAPTAALRLTPSPTAARPGRPDGAPVECRRSPARTTTPAAPRRCGGCDGRRRCGQLPRRSSAAIASASAWSRAFCASPYAAKSLSASAA